MSNKVKLIVFDLDGTLLYTLKDLCDSANYALAKCGYPTWTLDDYRYFVGRGIRNMILAALPESDRNEVAAERVEAEFYPYYNEHKCDTTAPYNGIVEVLHQIKAAGIKIAVATNKYQAGAEGVMEAYFGEIGFDLVLGQIDTRPIKPAPDIVFDAMRHFDASADDTLYIGDSNVDMQTGINAGVRTVGVLWGFRSRKELEAYKPWRIVETPSDILELI